MKFNEQGRSMIEMLGVLAIVGVLSVGGIAGYSKAMAKFNTNKAVDQVNMIATNIRTMFASQSNYTGLSNNVAIKANLIPSELFTKKTSGDYGSTDISNPFGGNIYVQAGQNTTANDTFVITMDKIPSNACVAMATTEWGSEAGGGLVAMLISTGDAKTAAGNAASSGLTSTTAGVYLTSDDAFPLAVSSAVTHCSNAENTIAWKYL